MGTLGQLQEILTGETYECIFIPAFEELPVDHLVVLLGIDSKEREQKLEISEYQRAFDFEGPAAISGTLIAHLQFKILFPFRVSDLAVNDLSALVHFINHSTNFPGFEFDELNGRVIFRYVLIIPFESINAMIIKNLFQSIQFNLILFSDLIEQVATNKSTFNDILSEIVKKFDSN